MSNMNPLVWIEVAVAIVCLLMLVRLMLSARHRARLDGALRGARGRVKRRALMLWHWRSSRRAAAQVTQAAIDRARRTRGTQKGNVHEPDAFKGPRRPH